jgi:hypothetical protein
MEGVLFYTSLGYNRKYIQCLKYYVKSLLYTNNCRINLLVLCDESFRTEVLKTLEEYANLNVIIHTRPDTYTPEDASMHKIHVFECPDVHKYTVALYVDVDCLFTGSFDFIFRKPIEDNQLYVYPENGDLMKNTISWYSLSQKDNPKWLYYSNRELNEIVAEARYPFNAGLFMFRITPLMEQHFRKLIDFVTDFRTGTGVWFYEQSFMNTYFHINKMTNYSIFTTDLIFMLARRDVLRTPAHRLVHFNSSTGDGKTKLDMMDEEWKKFKAAHKMDTNVFDTRDKMIAALVPSYATIVEIGVFKGDFARKLLQLNPRKLYLVDVWADETTYSGNVDGNDLEQYNGLQLYNDVKSRFKLMPNTHIVRARSDEFIPKLADHSVDVAYIDGDDSYEGVKRDLECIFPKMRRGGWIMGHDYEMNMAKAKHVYNFGVKQAVDEFCVAHNLKINAKGMDGCVSYAIYLDPDVV